GVVHVVAPAVEPEDEVRRVARTEPLRNEDRDRAIGIVDVRRIRLAIVRVAVRALLVREHRVAGRRDDHRPEIGVALGEGGESARRRSEEDEDDRKEREHAFPRVQRVRAASWKERFSRKNVRSTFLTRRPSRAAIETGAKFRRAGTPASATSCATSGATSAGT